MKRGCPQGLSTFWDSLLIISLGQPFGTYTNKTATNNPVSTADGTYTIKVTSAANGAADVGTFVIDTTGPAAPTVTSQSTSNTTPLLSGMVNLEAGGTLTVVVNNASYTMGSGDGKVEVTGVNWELQLPAALDLGTYAVTATTADEQGNSTDDVTTDELKIIAQQNHNSSVTGVVYSATDRPVAGIIVKVKDAQGLLKSAVTDADGKYALTGLPAAQLTVYVENSTKVLISEPVVTTDGQETTKDLKFPDIAAPASIEGIVSVGGKVIAGATVTISEDLGPPIGLYTTTVTTDANGRYKLLVPLGGRAYTIKITAPIEVDGKTVNADFEQKAQVGTGTVSASKQISGKLFVKGNTDKSINTIFNSSNAVSGKIFNEQGNLLNLEVKIDSEGRYQVEELQAGTYRLLFQLTVGGQKLAGIWKTIKVSADGEIAIEPSLIDPYGIVRDSVTKAPIQGSDMQLYWADTQLNRDKGRTPHTLVDLPILPEFAPNQNRNTQLTTAAGEYAWMVFANGDYYLMGVKNGYITYDSRNEGRTVAVKPGEDSWITDGIIHVGESIVEYNLFMDGINTIGLTAQPPTETSVNLNWNTVSGAVYYSVYANGQFLATVQGVTHSVYGLASGTTYPFYVTAVNGEGQTLTSNTVNVTTLQSLAQINKDIENALKNLRIGYSRTDIWESITLPVFLVKDGDYGTLVGWHSSNEAVIKITEEMVSSVEGGFEPNKRKFTVQVNRQAADVDVILTATVSKSIGTPLSRTFLLVVKSNQVDEEKVTVDRGDNSVVVNGQQVATTITRTTLSNNKIVDKLIVTENQMDQVLQASNGQQVAKLQFSDKPANTSDRRADEIAFEVPIRSIEKLGASQALQVSTPEGGVKLEPDSITKLKNKGYDLYFVIVPKREENAVAGNARRQELSTYGSLTNVTFLDIPRELKTNISKNDGIETVVTLPLSNITLPLNPTERQQYLDSLRVFIQHSDGTKEIVGGTGHTPFEIVYENGVPTGIQFKVTHFSTFTMFREEAIAEEPSPTTPPVAVAPQNPVPVEVSTSTAKQDQATIEIVLTGKVTAFDQKALKVLIGGKPVEIAKVELNDGIKLVIKLKNPIPAGYQVIVAYDAKAATGLPSGSQALPTFEVKLQNGDTHTKYMNGYPDGEFKPNNSITRAEMAAVLSRLLGRGEEKHSTQSYPDVQASHWASSNIEVMMETGIMKGYDDGEFKPERPITRAEFAATVLRFIKRTSIQTSSGGYSFPDIAQHWARQEIEAMKQFGYMQGENGLFHPDRNLSRVEAVTTLNRVLKRGPLTGDFKPSWPDVPTTNWGYGDVEEASRSHEFTRFSDKEERLIRFLD